MDDLRNMTLKDLEQYDGTGGARAYVAYKGEVYDVTDSDTWKDGEHLGEHYAGEDLTDAMEDAPHEGEVMKGFPVVGLLEE